MVRAVWVLLDFLDRVEFHSPGDFPVKIVFFSGGEMYEVVHAAEGQEALVSSRDVSHESVLSVFPDIGKPPEAMLPPPSHKSLPWFSMASPPLHSHSYSVPSPCRIRSTSCGRFGKGIINNSKTKIILNLEDEEAVRVQDALHLSADGRAGYVL